MFLSNVTRTFMVMNFGYCRQGLHDLRLFDLRKPQRDHCCNKDTIKCLQKETEERRTMIIHTGCRKSADIKCCSLILQVRKVSTSNVTMTEGGNFL